MALAASQQIQPIAAFIVMGMSLLLVVILACIAIQAVRRERIHKRRADEFETMFKEARHYDNQITNARKLYKF